MAQSIDTDYNYKYVTSLTSLNSQLFIVFKYVHLNLVEPRLLVTLVDMLCISVVKDFEVDNPEGSLVFGLCPP